MVAATVRPAMIEGRRLSKVFNDFWGRPKVRALRDVDFLVREGTVFGLLGPNGAGKSTLMKLALGHLYPTDGTISVLGRDPRDVMSKKRLGYLPERVAFYDSLTAGEILLFFGRLLGLPDTETRRRSEQLLDMVGLEKTRGRLVGEFSHGMRKRLGLAQALLNDPDLLLLDEPTAGLDPIGCREVKDLILTLGRRGKTIVITSHLLADIEDVCGEIMILYGGETQAKGTVDALLAKKDEVQIRAGLDSEGTLREIQQLLAGRSVSPPPEISFPRRSLEEYFLSVVAAAKKANKETFGADIGAGVAEYLSEGVDTAALRALNVQERAVAATPPAVVPALDADALKALTEARPAREAEPTESTVDANALSSLTRKPKP